MFSFCGCQELFILLQYILKNCGVFHLPLTPDMIRVYEMRPNFVVFISMDVNSMSFFQKMTLANNLLSSIESWGPCILALDTLWCQVLLLVSYSKNVVTFLPHPVINRSIFLLLCVFCLSLIVVNLYLGSLGSMISYIDLCLICRL